jgi:hypothetical protein
MGWFAGRASLRTETAALVATERAEVASLSLPLADAVTWARLIRQNVPISQILASARPNTAEASGRAMLFNVWLDPPRPPTPGVH